MCELVERIVSGDVLIAIIVRSDFDQAGIHFLTEPQLSQQLAYINHPRGKRIAAHFQKPVLQKTVSTQEVLIIKSGILRVDLYDPKDVFLESRLLKSGDIILLAGGGHGFEVIEDVRMIEVKQGPYSDQAEKTLISHDPI